MRDALTRGRPARFLARVLARRVSLVAVLAAVPIVVLAGCGASANGGLYGGASSTSATGGTSSQTTSATVATESAMVSGATQTILTAGNGYTLYYFTLDSSATSACATGCVGTWPPLTMSSGTPTSSAQLPGALTVRDSGNGSQVQYNGHPLYRYSGDTAAGQTNGEGIDGHWFVATPSLAVNSGSTGQPGTTPSPTPCSGYYCGGG